MFSGRYTFRLRTLLFVTAVLLCSARAWSDVQLSLSTDREAVFPYEAVRVRMEAKNTGDQPVSIHADVLTHSPRDIMVVKKPNGHVLELSRLTPSFGYFGDVQIRRIAPGETAVFEGVVTMDWGGDGKPVSTEPVFTEPGTYELHVIYNDDSLYAVSSTVQVEVVPPTPAERRAHARLGEMQNPHLLFVLAAMSSDARERDFAILREVATYEESEVYVRYARLAMGLYHLGQARKHHLKQNPVENVRRELSLASDYLDNIDPEGFPLAERVKSTQAEIERRRKNLKNRATSQEDDDRSRGTQ